MTIILETGQPERGATKGSAFVRFARETDGSNDVVDSGSSSLSKHQVVQPESIHALQKRVLVLSVSAGVGHVRAAEAITAHINAHEPDAAATHLDVMNYVPAGFREVYTGFYIKLISKYPGLWRYLYQYTNDSRPDGWLHTLRRGFERLNTRKLLDEIESYQPDAIVCTHFLPAEILSSLIRTGNFSCPVWVQVTDFDLHRMWVHEGMTGYFAANAEVAFRLREQGIAAHAIHITGIPIMRGFSQPLNRSLYARKLGLDPDRLTFLLMGGGAGLGALDKIAERVLALGDHFQLIVMAGKNASTLAALQALAVSYPGRLVALGFTSKVQRLMACADLAITKPGGLTTSECLAMGLPMIVNSPIPGQEEQNANFLLEQGVALKAFDAVTLEYRIRYLLECPGKLAEMRAKAKILGRPSAARHVTSVVLEEIGA